MTSPRILIYIFLTLLLFESSLYSSPGLYGDPATLLRAGRWEVIQNLFKINKPGALQQKYIHARAIENIHIKAKSSDTPETIRHYLIVLGADCRNAAVENDFIKCISGIPEGKMRELHERLAVYHAADIALKARWLNLHLNILKLANLRQNDPLTRSIYGDLISAYLNTNNTEEAYKIASQNSTLTSPVVNMKRAAAYYKSGRKTESMDYYLKAASSGGISWITQSIYTNVKNNFPGIFSGNASSQPMLRYFVCLSPHMNADELNFLKNAIPYNILISTSNQETILHDGVFLIKTGQTERLHLLSEKNYTFLSQNPDILRVWIESIKYQDASHALRLMQTFNHTKVNKASLWRANLGILESTKNEKAYFDELIAYLSKNHSDYRMADKLIEHLIGSDSGKIRWADMSFWEKAKNEIPGHTGSGRFIYWLKRYYESRKDFEAAAGINEHFYEMSPGSYYSQSFWDDSKDANYAAEWYKVYDRKSYLRWVARYGGNEKAVKFLAGKYIEPYRDVNSIKLAGYLKNISYNIPYEIKELYTLGEFALAEEFYADYYDEKISYTENLLRKYHLGKTTGNLHISTYYMRSLLREYNIPEDPFSLDPFILEDLYPRPYLSTVRKYSQTYRIDENMIYGLMRQESMFRETAVSRSGAKGLMQIMPRTGKWLADMMKMNNPDLMEPEVSIQLGAKFFGDLIRKYNNDFRWASIAYNGGPGNLSKWKKQHYQGDFNLFLELLPVEESRNYCRFTYQNYNHYKVTYTLYP